MLRLPPFDKIGTTPTPDFTNADPASGQAGSIVNGLVFNQLQHEGENLELLAGLTPASDNLTQWAQAVSRGGIWVGSLTGTGDLAVATLGAVLPALLPGMRIGGLASATNATTSPKLRVTNLGTSGGYTDYPILMEDGSAPAIGAIKPGARYRFEVDGAGNVVISGGGIGATYVLDGQVFATPGTTMWTPPPGCYGYYVDDCKGGGGGGGGSAGTANSAGSGGGGGGRASGFQTCTPGVGVPATVGGAGQGGQGGSTPTAGTAGGTSSIGAMSATGGGPGSAGSGALQTSSGPGGTATGGTNNDAGFAGQLPYLVGSSIVLASGGKAPGGSFTPTAFNTTAAVGNTGIEPGDGGGGGALSGAGGAGKPGIIRIRFLRRA